MSQIANIDYCGILVLLRHLNEIGTITDSELERIAARIAAQIQADIVISF